MSALKAKKFFDSLNPQQRQFVESKTISTSLSVKNWIGFLSKASSYDHYADAAITNHIGTIVALVILTLLAAFLTPIVEYPVLVSIPVVLGLITFYFIQKRNQFKRRDINNYLRLFFMPFLEMLRVKAGEEAKLSASLDFRNPLKAASPATSKVRGRDLEIYQPKYILAKVSLLDGSYLEFAVADDIKKYSYRNANGRFKSKTKTVHQYFIKLSLPKNRYKLKTQTFPDKVSLEEVQDEYIFKLKGKQKANNYVLLKLELFVASLQSLFDMVEDISLPTGSLQSGTTQSQEKQLTDSGLTDTGSLASNIPFLIWTNSYFNRRDYDSTSESGDVPLITEQDSKLNVFQS